MTKAERRKIDAILDISQEVCPMTLVLTKRHIEKLEPGQCLEVILSDGEAVRSISLSTKEEGHRILLVEKEDRFIRMVIERS
jgi:tRNA 2-thiouridine synthesizing protein A